MTASKVESCEDSVDCYYADLSWSEIARDLDHIDYQQNITVEVMIKNTDGTTSQQLTILILPYRPQPFLVIFSIKKYIIILQCEFSGSYNPRLPPSHSNSVVFSIGHRVKK